MKNLTTYILFLFFGLIISISSCNYDYYVEPHYEITDTVSFENDILPIFNNSCNTSGCHNTGGIAPDLTPLNAYNNLFLYNLVDTANPELSVLYERMNSSSKPMPSSGKLPPLQIATVLAWIDQGGNNN